MPDDSNWKTPIESPRASISYVLRSSSGIFAMSSPRRSSVDRLVDHVEVAEAEEVHLQQAERLDVPHPELRDRLLALALALQRHDVGQRPVAR